jgi:predicted DNA-binding transcriptional regulator AlpA
MKKSSNDLLSVQQILDEYLSHVRADTFREWVRVGTFPHPDQSVSSKSRWWRRSTVVAWLERRAAGKRRREPALA